MALACTALLRSLLVLARWILILGMVVGKAQGGESTLAGSPKSTQFFVSSDGDDRWSGRTGAGVGSGSEGPFASLARAREAVRAARRSGEPGPFTVVVAAGTYFLEEPLRLTSEDSGVTYRADGEVILSGGRRINGCKKGEQGRWFVEIPEAAGGKWAFKLLRVGENWARRARHPNFDPREPLKGGWLFADWHGEPWERGRFKTTVGGTYDAGDQLTWRIRVPVSGVYHVWLRYGSAMPEARRGELEGGTSLRVDETAPGPLLNVPDTGGWTTFRWARSARLELTSGEHTLTWRNDKGVRMALDALALTDDDAWDPETAIANFTWWGAYELKRPQTGNLVLIQAEACERAEGSGIKVPSPTPPGVTQHLRFRPGDMPQWRDLTGAEVHVFPAWGWVNGIAALERIDYEGRRIFLPGSGAAQDIRMGNRYFIENVREALDAPGEWYLDTKTGRLEYLAEDESFPNFEVFAPRLDRLIELRGTSTEWVENIRFEGFTFTDTDYTVTSNYYQPEDAAIHMSRARRCMIRGCVFRRLGGHALRLEDGSHEIAFTGNELHHLGQGGVLMLGQNANQPHHNLVAGNTMRHLGLIYKHVAGVYCITASANRIAHNTMSDLSRYGVAAKSLSPEACSYRNVIEFNDIRRSNLETNDTGAIETLGRGRADSGNIIRHNLILDVVGVGTEPDGTLVSPYFNWGIYLDDYSSGTTVYGNIVARTVNGGLCVHGGRNNVFENNVFVDAANEQIRLQPRDDFMQGNRFVRNIIAYSGAQKRLIYSWDGRKDRFSEWDHNVYWLRDGDLKAGKTATPLGRYQKWLDAGFDANSLVGDPLFIDAERDDYRLREGSPALERGFKPIPVERIGMRGWTGN